MNARKLLLLLVFYLLSISIAAIGEPLPEATKQRVLDIVRNDFSPKAKIIAIKKVKPLPGLTDATYVEFSIEGQGKQSFVMLPSGYHYITGDLLAYRPPAADQRSRAPSTLSDKEVDHRNTILESSDFRKSVLSRHFEDPEVAPQAYFRLIEEAPGPVQGTGGLVYHVMYDPACPHCRKKRKDLKPLVDSGKVSVHWIPTIAVSPKPWYSLQALAAPDSSNEALLERLKAIHAGDRLGVKLTENESKTASENLYKITMLRQMLANWQEPLDSAGTPQGFYQLPDGTIKHHYGYNESHVEELARDLAQ